jgi:hypothetical protein
MSEKSENTIGEERGKYANEIPGLTAVALMTLELG